MLLTEFLNDIVSKRANILTSDSKQVRYNLTSEIEEMNREDKVELMFALL